MSGEWVAAGKRGDRDVVLSDLNCSALDKRTRHEKKVPVLVIGRLQTLLVAKYRKFVDMGGQVCANGLQPLNKTDKN